MQVVPVFTPGEQPRAEQFQQLVDAVREQLVARGLFGLCVAARRRRRCFVPQGEAVARMNAEGKPEAYVAEMLWQAGEYVKVLPGGVVDKLPEAVAKAEGYGSAVGLHGSAAVTYHGSGIFTLEGTAMEYQAAAWVPAEPDAEGALPADAWHGPELCGCVCGVENVLRQRQRAHAAWRWPQWPAIVRRGTFQHAEHENVHGSEALLPCLDYRQLLVGYYGGYYPGNNHMEDFVVVRHEWHARLDMHGQLRISAENYGE